MFKGTYTAIVTPFKNRIVDYESLENLINFQINGGINGIISCGTTGESPILDYKEYCKIIQFTIEIVKKRVQIIIGTGSNNTNTAIHLSKYAQKCGVDGLLIVSPYYNKPTQEGIHKHYINIANEVNTPIILYNIQSRTGININIETIISLSQHKNIIGIKEASSNLEQAMNIIKYTNKNFSLLSGDDILSLSLLNLGGKGVISVISNIIPVETSKFINNCLQNNFTKAKEWHYKYLELMKVLFIDTNPIPIKQALNFMNKCEPDVRLPLCIMNKLKKDKLKLIMKKLNIL